MRLPEQRLWDRMRAAFGEYGVLAHRIENVVAVGMPDVVTACNGAVSFLELKAIAAAPARNTTPLLGAKHGLSAEQRNWHHDWNAANCVTFVVIGVGREVLVIDGREADLVNRMTYRDALAASRAMTWHGLVSLLGCGRDG